MSQMAEESRGAVIDPDTAPIREMQLDRGFAIRLVDSGVGAHRIDWHINVLKADGVPGPYHYHSESENAYFVLDGLLRVRIDGVAHDVGPGMAVFIPPGVPHSASNIGGSEARLLEIYSPPNPDFVWVEEEDATA